MVFNLITGKYPFDLSYNGSWSGIKGDPLEDWYAIFYGSGTLTIQMAPETIDVFLLGGGYNGAKGNGKIDGNTAQYWYGGKGGNGGSRKTVLNLALPEGEKRAISVGGVAEISSAFGHSSNESGYSQAAGGGQCGKGADGGYAFGDSSFDGIKYGAAGGGGGYIEWTNVDTPYRGGWHSPAGGGGADGGGSGGGGSGNYDWDANGNSATQYGGGGGGGCGGDGYGASGKGGLVIIRNHRE